MLKDGLMSRLKLGTLTCLKVGYMKRGGGWSGEVMTERIEL